MDFVQFYQSVNGGDGINSTRDLIGFLTSLDSIEIDKPHSYLLYKKRQAQATTRPPSPQNMDNTIIVERLPATALNSTTFESTPSMNLNLMKQIKKKPSAAMTIPHSGDDPHASAYGVTELANVKNTSILSSPRLSVNDDTNSADVGIAFTGNMPGIVLGGHDQEDDGPGFVREGVNGLAVKPCKCKRSRCLKMYCDCFAAQLYCTGQCTCQDCYNTDLPWHAAARKEVIDLILEKNPNAFENKVQVIEHRGCNCKRSNCLKKYCECYAVGLHCTDTCKCVSCLNRPGAVIPEGLQLPIPTPYRTLGAAGIAAVEASNVKILTSPHHHSKNLADTTSPSISNKRMKAIGED